MGLAKYSMIGLARAPSCEHSILRLRKNFFHVKASIYYVCVCMYYILNEIWVFTLIFCTIYYILIRSNNKLTEIIKLK